MEIGEMIKKEEKSYGKKSREYNVWCPREGISLILTDSALHKSQKIKKPPEKGAFKSFLSAFNLCSRSYYAWGVIISLPC